MHRLVATALLAGATAAVTAVFTELSPVPARGAQGDAQGVALCTSVCAGVRATPGPPVEWVAVPSAPGCEASADPDACHRVTVEGTGVDCDPQGCALDPGDTGWQSQMELQAVEGMYLDDPPPTPTPGVTAP